MNYLIKNNNWKLIEEYNLDKLLYLLIDRYDTVEQNIGIVWQNDVKSHDRDYDLPAVYCNDDLVVWYKNGKYYRKNNKPSMIWFNSYQKIYINENL